jgi:D-serine deaminase-like pyridoxal phosphate-dependent protein
MDLRELHTPALLVDVDRLSANIATMAASLRGTALRPHVKTSKCWEVVRRQLAAGAAGLTCSTAAEVEWLRERGVTELLWANVPVGPAKVAVAVSTPGLTVTLDSVAAALPLSPRPSPPG